MSLTLYFLPLRAQAEPIRMILQYGNIQFNDITIAMADWPQMKLNHEFAPFGQLPILKLSTGEIIAQSGAIIRFVAKLAGIYPSDPLAAARADMIFEFSQELNMINPLLNFWPTNTDAWSNNCNVYFETLSIHLDTATRLLGELEFFGGDTPHHGDFAMFHILESCLVINPTCLDNYPSLRVYIQRMFNLPTIRSFLSSRLPPQSVGMCGSFVQTEVAKINQHH